MTWGIDVIYVIYNSLWYSYFFGGLLLIGLAWGISRKGMGWFEALIFCTVQIVFYVTWVINFALEGYYVVCAALTAALWPLLKRSLICLPPILSGCFDLRPWVHVGRHLLLHELQHQERKQSNPEQPVGRACSSIIQRWWLGGTKLPPLPLCCIACRQLTVTLPYNAAAA